MTNSIAIKTKKKSNDENLTMPCGGVLIGIECIGINTANKNKNLSDSNLFLSISVFSEWGGGGKYRKTRCFCLSICDMALCFISN